MVGKLSLFSKNYLVLSKRPAVKEQTHSQPEVTVDMPKESKDAEKPVEPSKPSQNEFVDAFCVSSEGKDLLLKAAFEARSQWSEQHAQPSSEQGQPPDQPQSDSPDMESSTAHLNYSHYLSQRLPSQRNAVAMILGPMAPVRVCVGVMLDWLCRAKRRTSIGLGKPPVGIQ